MYSKYKNTYFSSKCFNNSFKKPSEKIQRHTIYGKIKRTLRFFFHWNIKFVTLKLVLAFLSEEFSED